MRWPCSDESTAAAVGARPVERNAVLARAAGMILRYCCLVGGCARYRLRSPAVHAIAILWVGLIVRQAVIHAISVH